MTRRSRSSPTRATLPVSWLRREQQLEFLTDEALTLDEISGSGPVIRQQLLRDTVWHVVCGETELHEHSNSC